MHVFGLQEEVGATTQAQGQVANLIQHGSNRAGDLTQNLASVETILTTPPLSKLFKK